MIERDKQRGSEESKLGLPTTLMAESVLSSRKCNPNPDGSPVVAAPSADGSPVVSAPSSDGSLLIQRRIGFHPEKQTFKGFSNGGGGGFRVETLNPEISNPRRRADGNRSGLAAHSKKRRNGSETLGTELSFGITLKRIGAGLQNLGNTCYLNSVLQCLTYTEPLVISLQSGGHRNSCRAAGFCALCAIQTHVSDALKSNGRSLAPKDLVSNLRCISRNFRRARQEDAHEYMINLLESMHKCCLPAGVPSESPSAYEKSLIHDIFGGRLRSQVKCTQCSFCSNKFDPFLDLSLEIIKAESLHKALAHFAAKEYIDGGARQYQCQRCNQKVKALKQLTIDKAPNVLTVHLKRFDTYQHERKIDKRIHFGRTLDLRPFVTGQHDEDLKYTLYGVLVHDGWNTRCGHYYSFVRTSSGMWYSLDDHKVRQVSEKMVLGQEAYMLFYVRDRKKYAPKKPVQKEIVNSMGNNRMHSDRAQCFKETPEISSAVPGENLLFPSVVGYQRDAAAASKDESVDKTSSPVINNNSLLKEGRAMDLSHRDLPYLHGKNLSQTIPIKGSAVFGICEGKTNELNELRVTKKDPCGSISLTPESKEQCNFVNVPSTNKNSPMVCAKEVPKIIDPVVSLDRLSLDSTVTESGSPSKESVLGDGKTLVVTESEKLSGMVTRPISQEQKALHHKPQRLLKKKLIKCCSIVQLGSSMLFKASLGHQKRMCKRVGRRNMKVKIRAREALLEGISNEEFRDSQGQNCAVLATGEKFEIDSTPSVGHQENVVGSTCSKGNRTARVHDVSVSTLIRSSEETRVARWYGWMEESSCEITESSGAKTIALGYVGDEWDEEYDQGKRKKVRKPIAVFGGANPFQEIATKNAKKHKKTKM